MARPSHREKILAEGLKLVHERGFGAASVRDIVRAAGVPQGSFTNHFASKEAFGLEILDLYFESTRRIIAETLLDESRRALARIEAFVDCSIARTLEEDVRCGCMIGNFTAEVADQSEPLRRRLVEIFAEIRSGIAKALQAAVDAGEVSRDFDVAAVTDLILSGLQGSTLVAKAERDRAVMDRFKQLLFTTILR